MVHFVREQRVKTWMTFNKDDIGGLIVPASDKKSALRLARQMWGKGAKVEFYGKQLYTTIRNR